MVWPDVDGSFSSAKGRRFVYEHIDAINCSQFPLSSLMEKTSFHLDVQSIVASPCASTSDYSTPNELHDQ
jgi:hypothetical protein